MAAAALLAIMFVAPPALGASGPSSLPVGSGLLVSVANVSVSPSGFWGANVRVYYPLNTTNAADFNGTPLSFARWPGGAVADEYNLTANVVTHDNGTTYAPRSNITQFAHWCVWVSCRAILQLPGEIDQPATAAFEVAYVEHTVGFHPAYWEIGNEPAQWTHFGFPWARWNTSQATNATPGTYAALVHAYAAAIHRVDAKAALIGLPGVGTGGYNEVSWITATVQRNGPNLSAVAIHVYPAGFVPTTPVTNGSFVASLSGHGSLTYRIPLDRAAVTAACPTCGPIPVLVDELGSGTAGGPYAGWMGGYLDVPYLAAEVVQALQIGVANVDLYSYQGTYNGSLLTPAGSPTMEYPLYAQLLSKLGPGIRSVTLSSPIGPVYAVATVTAAGGSPSLLLVNLNLTTPLRLSLLGSGLPLLGPGSAWSWTRGSGLPRPTPWSLAAPLLWNVPPASILLLTFA